MREIPNTKLLVSLSHSYLTSANMEIFDISKKTPKKIYSFEETFGRNIDLILNLQSFHILDVGDGDITYNSRRNILAAIPLTEKIAYHLFDVGYSARKNSPSVKLLKKAKWIPECARECSFKKILSDQLI